MILIFFISIIIFFIILLFSLKTFSPIPYFPTNRKDLSKIINQLLKSRSVFDFGAGDGTVIFGAAKKAYEKNLATQFYAIEINPILIFILHLKRLFHPNKKNIHIIWGDMFKTNIKNQILNHKNQITIYLYISPWLVDKLLNHLKNQFLNFHNITFVSYFYPIKSLKKKERVIKGINKIYVYKL